MSEPLKETLRKLRKQPSATTLRQLKLSLGALSFSLVVFILITSYLARMRRCPSYPATPVQSTAASAPNQLSLLLYNLQLRPRLLFSTQQSTRAEQLAHHLQGYNAIILSETFDDYALSELKSRYAYSNISTPLGQNEGLSQDSGLAIFSQWPIVLGTQHQKIFDGPCTGRSCFNYQGVIAIGIQNQKEQSSIYHLLTAQFQAGNSSRAVEIRQHQYQQIRQFIDIIDIPTNEPVIFAASLPISPQTHPDEYQQMIATIGLIPFSTNTEQHSLDPAENTLASANIPQTPDAVFTLTDSLPQPQSMTLQVRPMRTSPEQAWQSSPLLYWQCKQQNLSDHHAIEAYFDYTR